MEAPSRFGSKESLSQTRIPTRQELLDEYMQPLRRQTELLEKQRMELQQEAKMLAVLANPAKVLAQPGLTKLAAKVSEMAWSAEYGDFLRSRMACAETMRRKSMALQVLQAQGYQSSPMGYTIRAMGPPIVTRAYQVHDGLRRRTMF